MALGMCKLLGIGGRFDGIGMFDGMGNGEVGVGDAPPSP
jgi:hypothetical protein